jgi:hypothetical protein
MHNKNYYAYLIWNELYGVTIKMRDIQRNLRALREIINSTTFIELDQISSIRTLIEDTSFYLQSRFIYDKYKNKYVYGKPVSEIIDYTYDDIIPEEFWLIHNTDGKLTKIQPGVCIMAFSSMHDTHLETIRQMLSEFNELISFYKYNGLKINTKCDRYYNDEKLFGFYIYTTVDIK